MRSIFVVKVEVDAVGNDAEFFWIGAVHALEFLIAFVKRDDFGRRFVAEARIIAERIDPQILEIAFVMADMGDREIESARIVDPVGAGDFDAAFVGVNAVLGNQARTAGFQMRARQHEAGITGAHRMIGFGRRQIGQKNAEQSAEQPPPRPEIIQEGGFRHRRLIDAQQHVPHRRMNRAIAGGQGARARAPAIR